MTQFVLPNATEAELEALITPGDIALDTTNDVVRVGDGRTPGGIVLADAAKLAAQAEAIFAPTVNAVLRARDDATAAARDTAARDAEINRKLDTSGAMYLFDRQVAFAETDAGGAVIRAVFLDGSTWPTSAAAAASSFLDSSDLLYLFDRQIVFAETDAGGAVIRAVFLDGSTYPARDAIGYDYACNGDSITAQTDTPSYPAVLATATGREAYQGGIGGQTSTQIAARQGGVVAPHTVANNQLVAGANAITAIGRGQLTGTGYYSTFTASIAGATLTVSAISGGVIQVGAGLYNGANVDGNTLILAQLSGAPGGIGTYQLTIAANLDARQMIFGAPSDNPWALSSAADRFNRSDTGTLGSVHGTRSRSVVVTNGVPLETYVFTPDPDAVLPALCPPGTIYLPDCPYDDRTQILWLGRNNWQFTDRLKADITACAAKLHHGRFVILPVLNALNEVNQGDGAYSHNAIFALEQWAAQTFPANFLNIRRLLIDRGVQDAIALFGLGAGASAGQDLRTQPQRDADAADVAGDTIPHSLRKHNPDGSVDIIHPNGTANRLIGGVYLPAYLASKGL